MRGLVALVWVEVKLFVRDPFAAFFSLAFPLLVLVVLAGIFGNKPDPRVFRGVGPVDYYVPAYIGLVLASIGLLGLPVHLAGYRELGVLRRFHASSIPTWAVFGSQVLVGLITAVLGSLLLVAVGFGGYGVRMLGTLPGVVVAFAVASISFMAVGFFLAAVLPSSRSAQAAGLLLFFVMMFLSGADGPREVMPDWMRHVGDWLPLTHVITALQDPWLSGVWNVGELLILGGMAVAATVVAVRLFRWN